MTLTCPICKQNSAIHHPYYGWLPCASCQDKKPKKPNHQVEFVSESIKEQRKAHLEDIQPAHRKGIPSREFRDKWGKAAMKRQGYTDQEIKNAKYVWNDNQYYKKED